MSTKTPKWILAAAIAGVLPQFAGASMVTTVMDFDALVDGTQVGEAYASAGYHWKNAKVFDAVVAGADFALPPSGNNVVLKGSDAGCGAACDVLFNSDIAIFELVVSGMNTGSGTLHAIASDGTVLNIDILGNGSGCSGGVAPGWSCNRSIQFSLAQNITRITFNGPGGLAAIDSLSVTQHDLIINPGVPEPASLALVALGLIGAACARRRRSV